MASLVKVSSNLKTPTLLTDFLTCVLIVILIKWWHIKTTSPNCHLSEVLGGGGEGKGDSMDLLRKLK